MGYTLKKHAIEVEINGAAYTVDYGDAGLLDDVAAWQAKLQEVDYGKLDDGRARVLQADIDGFLRALLGAKQLDALKESVGDWDLLIAIEAFAILYHEITTADVGGSVAGILGKYLPDEADAI